MIIIIHQLNTSKLCQHVSKSGIVLFLSLCDNIRGSYNSKFCNVSSFNILRGANPQNQAKLLGFQIEINLCLKFGLKKIEVVSLIFLQCDIINVIILDRLIWFDFLD